MRALLLIPALLLAGCPDTDRQDPPPASARARAVTHHLGALPDLKLRDARILVRAARGSGPDQLGMRDEASRPGPMDLAVSEDGVLHVLDQVNRRVQRYSPAGERLTPLPLDGETAEYIALGGGQAYALTYRPETTGHTVQRLSSRGPVELLTLAAGQDPVTGLFAVGSELWLERGHDRVIRISPGSAAGRVVMGRPHRGSPGHHVTASRGGLVIGVKPGDTTYRIMEVSPPAGSKIEAVEGLDTDAAGRVYLALLLVSAETSPHEHWQDVRRVAVVHRPGARPLTVELPAHQATNMNNYLAAGPGGGLFQLQTTAQGVVIRRWQVTDAEVQP